MKLGSISTLWTDGDTSCVVREHNAGGWVLALMRGDVVEREQQVRHAADALIICAEWRRDQEVDLIAVPAAMRR